MPYPNIEFVIALTGEKAAGKGKAARILAQEGGFAVFRFSDPIRVAHVLASLHPKAPESPELLAAKTADYIEMNMERDANGTELFGAEDYALSLGVSPPQTVSLQDMGNRWRKKFGGGVFTDVLLAAAELLRMRRLVIDGFRNPGELEPLRAHLEGRWVAVGVVADIDVRKKRFLEKRRRVGDPVTEEDFLKLDRRDKGEGEPDDGQQVDRCLTLVQPENIIANNRSTTELETNIARWYRAQVEPRLDRE
ncbi:MAG: hypothetical protein Q8Q39_00340 [bacterium]|nr:hypothetical protein [bacterium]